MTTTESPEDRRSLVVYGTPEGEWHISRDGTPPPWACVVRHPAGWLQPFSHDELCPSCSSVPATLDTSDGGRAVWLPCRRCRAARWKVRQPPTILARTVGLLPTRSGTDERGKRR